MVKLKIKLLTVPRNSCSQLCVIFTKYATLFIHHNDIQSRFDNRHTVRVWTNLIHDFVDVTFSVKSAIFHENSQLP